MSLLPSMVSVLVFSACRVVIVDDLDAGEDEFRKLSLALLLIELSFVPPDLPTLERSFELCAEHDVAAAAEEEDEQEEEDGDRWRDLFEDAAPSISAMAFVAFMPLPAG